MGYYAKIAQELIDRLVYHAGPGQMLAGLEVRESPVAQVDGLKDFPVVVLFVPGISEAYRVAGISAGGTMTLNLAVCTRRTEGIPALLMWVEKVLDALETKRDGSNQVDPNLGGTSKPFEAAVANSFIHDLSLTASITITVAPKPMSRGQRRNS